MMPFARPAIHGDTALAEPPKVTSSRRFPRWPVLLFLLSITVPVFFWIGPLRLSPYRLFLLVAVIPLLAGLLLGRCGRILAGDVLVLAFSAWVAASLFYNHGTLASEFAGVTFIETVGPYLLARHYIRSSEDLAALGRALSVIVLFLLPAALLEALDITRLYVDFFAAFAPTFPPFGDVRMGLIRAQTNFEHPILYGVFVASTFSLMAAIPNGSGSGTKGLWAAWTAIPATFLSLSVGAYLVLAMQLGLATWNLVFSWVRARWKLMIALFVVSYAIVDILSDRTPFEIFIHYLTFNAQTGYWRVHIWNFGLENVVAHPIFGLGLNDWDRPDWMHSASVDNFWLLHAMRYGIPGFVLIAAMYLYSVRTIGKGIPGAQGEDKQLRALAFSLLGIGVGICTVHLWGGTYAYFMFLLGAGLYGAASPGPGVRTDLTRSRNVAPNYTRFPPRN
jgi:hypothetical protein